MNPTVRWHTGDGAYIKFWVDKWASRLMIDEIVIDFLPSSRNEKNMRDMPSHGIHSISDSRG